MPRSFAILTIVSLFVLVALTGSTAFAITRTSTDQPASSSDTATTRALDARLSDFDYPYPVHIFTLESQGQTLEMAYMDIIPESFNGRTVLLLHGKNFSGAYWGKTIDTLVAYGFRVVVPDQIGFGKSSKPEHFQFSFHTLAQHTRQLLEHLDISNVAVVGHSMGGMLATRFTLMYPDNASKLVLINPIGLEDWKRVVPYQTVDAWYKQELAKTPDKIKAYMQASYFGGEWKTAYDPLVTLQAGWTRGNDYERIAWVSALTYDMIFTQPVLYEFPDLTRPTLLIIGQRDRTALGKNAVAADIAASLGNYPELGKRTEQAIPNARLIELDSVGHIPQYEAFDRYILELMKFLAEK